MNDDNEDCYKNEDNQSSEYDKDEFHVVWKYMTLEVYLVLVHAIRFSTDTRCDSDNPKDKETISNTPRLFLVHQTKSFCQLSQ